MSEKTATETRGKSTRREFVKESAVALLAAGTALHQKIARGAYAANDNTFRIGLVGCGGRGTGAAVQALTADANTKLIALADVFPDQLEKSLANLKKSNVADRVQVDADHKFVGFDGYKQLIDSEVDVVLLATPTHFRPIHLKACVDAGKHVFAEKPVAVDAPGIRSVLATCEEAKKKNLTIVSGLCWRYETGMQDTIQRIHDGAVGKIVTLISTRFSQGVSKMAERQPDWTNMEYQMRNWYYYTWLSGDFNVEQFVHEMDKMAWVMDGEYPIRCSSTGGRQARTAPEFGHIYDHFSTIFEYESGVRYVARTRHQRGCSGEFYDHVLGTDGVADLMKYTITGKSPWELGKRRTVMHQLEHDAMYAALRRGDTINNGEYMAKSTMMGIMARMSAYTGKSLTWEQAMNSKEDLSPPRYDWDAPIPAPPVAVPGVTPFV